jgi:signal peptidase I
MEDTLLIGDFLLADKLLFGPTIPLVDVRLPSIREPRPGDVVVFRHPDEPEGRFIKRIIAVENDWIEIADKQVIVNGRPLENEKYATYRDSFVTTGGFLKPRDNFGPVQVPPGHCFVLGDNRDFSLDSRYWGFIPRDLVEGRAFLIHWSWQPDPDAPRIRSDKPLSMLRLLAYNIVHLPQRVRWGRLFTIVD